MNDEKFVNVIELYVRDAAVTSTIANLVKPPGAKPLPALVEASKWYNAQNEDVKKVVNGIIRSAANHATLGFLAVIDGAKAIDNASPDRGWLELYYVSSSEKIRLNDPRTSTLNEIFR